MKILIVNTYYYPNIIGGAEVSVKKLAEGLYKRGIQVEILCTDTNDMEEVIDGVIVNRIRLNNIFQPIELRNKSNVKKFIGRINDIYNILNYKKINNTIERIKPDIIHVNNIYGISPIIWTIAKKMKIPIVHTIRDYYLMCPRINMMKRNQICFKQNIFCIFFNSINKLLSESVSIVTAPSQYTLDKFLSQSFFKKAKSQKIFNAIDFDLQEVNRIYKKKMMKNDEVITFVFMGTLSEYKGILLLLEEFSKINNPDIKLLIAGRGPLIDRVKEFSNNDNRIIYRGFLSESQINLMLEESDVLIAPSIWNEPFGRVVIDGYKNVMPVIVSNAGGLPEIVKDNKTGKIINPKNKNDLKRAIEYFINRDNIRNMLTNCIKELNNYSIDFQIDSFAKIYKSLI